MSVALFFITHEGIASSLITIGEAIIQKANSNISFCEVAMDSDIHSVAESIEDKLAQLDTKEGLLIITDIYGSTPSNIAQKIADKHLADLISGVNLPMVIRLLNYRTEAIKPLIQKTLDGAKQGIQHSPCATRSSSTDKHNYDYKQKHRDY
jgi:PTS system mannose-specific IIA component